MAIVKETRAQKLEAKISQRKAWKKAYRRMSDLAIALKEANNEYEAKRSEWWIPDIANSSLADKYTFKELDMDMELVELNRQLAEVKKSSTFSYLGY